MSTELLQSLLSKVTEISERTVRAEEKLTALDSKIDVLSEQVEELNSHDAVHSELIAEHIRGVKTNKQRLDLEISARLEAQQKHEERIKSLEAYPTFIHAFKSTLLYLAAIVGASTTLWQVLKALL